MLGIESPHSSWKIIKTGARFKYDDEPTIIAEIDPRYQLAIKEKMSSDYHQSKFVLEMTTKQIIEAIYDYE